MNRIRIPVSIFAIACGYFFACTESITIVIASILLFFAGYILHDVADIFNFPHLGFEELPIISCIILLCIFCTVTTIKLTDQMVFIILAIIAVVSGYVTFSFYYSFDDATDDNNNTNSNDNKDNDDNE